MTWYQPIADPVQQGWSVRRQSCRRRQSSHVMTRSMPIGGKNRVIGSWPNHHAASPFAVHSQARAGSGSGEVDWMMLAWGHLVAKKKYAGLKVNFTLKAFFFFYWAICCCNLIIWLEFCFTGGFCWNLSILATGLLEYLYCSLSFIWASCACFI